MPKTGIANLPLHGGKTPHWLFNRMVRLAREVTQAIIEEFGPAEILNRLSDPFWFQALGCVLGFDWHSSGVTTTVCGALKEAVKGHEIDFGFFVAGGKGGASRRTPDEIRQLSERFSCKQPGDKLVYYSRISAKVDNTALQDGYQLYHHNFFFTKDGLWTVVQQGMNPYTGWARRYHWLSSSLKDVVCEPHSAIVCDNRSGVINLVAKESQKAREASTLLACRPPGILIREIDKIRELNLPQEHNLSFRDIRTGNLRKVLLSTYSKQPRDFETLLGINGVGPMTIRALALLSELIYNAGASRVDPVTYSFAHGGKDGYPFPVNRLTYDNSIEILHNAIKEARLGFTEKKDAFKRLYSYSSQYRDYGLYG